MARGVEGLVFVGEGLALAIVGEETAVEVRQRLPDVPVRPITWLGLPVFFIAHALPKDLAIMGRFPTVVIDPDDNSVIMMAY